jgi:hypothetical protein
VSRAPAVRLCRGSDCTKERRAQERVLELVTGRARVIPVKCQKVCDGPVLGLEIEGEIEWFERVSGKAARAALAAWLDDGTLQKALQKRRVKKRSGRIR